MYKELNEQELAGYCCEKDPKAEEELYKRYAARVYTLCRRYMSNDDDAADLMQDTLLQALGKMQTYTYRGEGSLGAWINRIAVNKAVSLIKQRKRRALFLERWGRETSVEPSPEEVEKIPEEKLLAWISGLPDVRRAVFNMYCLDGYSHREIADELGISEKGSASMLTRARKQLKREIVRYLKEKQP